MSDDPIFREIHSGRQLDAATSEAIQKGFSRRLEFEGTAATAIEDAMMWRAQALHPDLSRERAFAKAAASDPVTRELWLEHQRFGHLSPAEWLRLRKVGIAEAKAIAKREGRPY